MSDGPEHTPLPPRTDGIPRSATHDRCRARIAELEAEMDRVREVLVSYPVAPMNIEALDFIEGRGKGPMLTAIDGYKAEVARLVTDLRLALRLLQAAHLRDLTLEEAQIFADLAARYEGGHHD